MRLRALLLCWLSCRHTSPDTPVQASTESLRNTLGDFIGNNRCWYEDASKGEVAHNASQQLAHAISVFTCFVFPLVAAYYILRLYALLAHVKHKCLA